MAIQVNTNNVRATASSLITINNNIESEFDNVKQAINKMNASWEGSAATSSMSEFNRIKSNFCGGNGRMAVMNKYINFLQSAVALDYETTELGNTKLADLFK